MQRSLNRKQLNAIRTALSQYDPSGVYDETFIEVSNRIASNQFASKLDVSTLAFWKRIRVEGFAGAFLETPDAKVRKVTRHAFSAGLSASQRLMSLAVLPGFGNWGAVATTLLAAWNPRDFGVMDRRAKGWLWDQGMLADRKTVTYLEALLVARDQLSSPTRQWTAREVDKSLFVLGR